MSRVPASRLVVIAVLGAATPALAQPADTARPPEDSWSVTLAPYLWATSLDGNASVGGIESDVDLAFGDLLKDVSFGAMALIDIQKGRFGVGVNGLFARVSPDGEAGDIEIDATSDTGQIAVAPFYRAVEWTYRRSATGRPLRLIVSPEAGLRFTYLRTELEVRGGPTVEGSESWIEPLFGSRVGLDLADRWTVAGEANIGGFGIGSEIAWNVQAFVGYRTAVFGRETTFALGYRALHQDYEDGDFEWDATTHGPIVGATLRF